VANIERERLHRLHGGKCFWCARRTKLIKPLCDGSLDIRTSTIDHLINSLDRPHELQQVVVNACHQCNRDRGKIAQMHRDEESKRKRLESDSQIYLAWRSEYDRKTGYAGTDFRIDQKPKLKNQEKEQNE